MGKIIAVTNQKGGVGKTTTSVNLAASLAATKHAVLLVDLDPQGNATMGCGVDKSKVRRSAYDVLADPDFSTEKALVPLESFGLTLLPGNSDLTASEVELLSHQTRERVLADKLGQIRDRFEYILVDCPPSLSMLTLNAMVAADSILVPMQCEYFALEGLSALMDTLKNIQKTVSPGLRMEGLLRTMFDTRSRLAKDVSDQLLEHFGDRVFRTIIPRNIRLAEAPSHGLPVLHYDRLSKGAVAYLALASEIVRRHATRAVAT